MSTDYAPLAAEVLKLVGGPDNVRSLHHCQTRLRFDLKDPGKVDLSALRAADGVATVMEAGNNLQVVIGLHVQDVHDEVQALLKSAGVTLGDNADEGAEHHKRGPVATFIDFMAGVFVPVIPAFAGAGMVRAVLAILVAFGWVDRASQTYVVLNFFAGAVFYFLPILLAFSAAARLNLDPPM